MASRPKRKYTSIREQEELLRQLYEDFDKDEEVFLGRRFIGNDDGDNDFVFSSASDDSDNDVFTATMSENIQIYQLFYYV